MVHAHTAYMEECDDNNNHHCFNAPSFLISVTTVQYLSLNKPEASHSLPILLVVTV